MEQKFEDILDTLEVKVKGKEEREQKKAEMKKKPYIIEAVKYPQNILFETEYILSQTIIKLNVNHPFYIHTLLPLCDPLGVAPLEADNKNSRIKDAIMLMLLSFAKAEAMFPDDNMLFSNLRSQWGTVLATAINSYETEDA